MLSLHPAHWPPQIPPFHHTSYPPEDPDKKLRILHNLHPIGHCHISIQRLHYFPSRLRSTIRRSFDRIQIRANSLSHFPALSPSKYPLRKFHTVRNIFPYPFPFSAAIFSSMTRTNHHYVSRRLNFHPARRRREAMRWHC